MTAVETLLDWLGKNHYYIGNDLLEKVEDIKEVEKQQIIDAWFDGALDTNAYVDFAEQYYNETFNKK